MRIELEENANHIMVMDLLDLPLNILITIFLRLPAESVCCIRCVSKPLLMNIVDDLFFVKLHRRLLITNNVAQVPQIMSFPRQFASARSPVLWFLQSVKYDGRALTKRKHAITVSLASDWIINYAACYYTIDFVFCNLIAFRNSADPGVCFLFNPLKGEVLRLPRNEVTKSVMLKRDWYGMGFDSMTNNYKIIRVSGVSNNGESCFVDQILVLRTSSWREIPSVPPGDLDYHHLIDVKNVCVHGDMHWLISGDFTRKGSEGICHHIVSFDFVKEEFYWTPHPQSSSKHFNHCDLLTLRGSMALGYISSKAGLTNIEIWVLKDYDRKEWTQDYTLNCKMFHPMDLAYLGLEDVTCGEWEHGIFFQTGSSIFFWDLNYQSINRIKFGSNILSYSSSLISLKDYHDVVQFESPEAGSYANLTEVKEHCFGFTEKHTLQRFVYR